MDWPKVAKRGGEIAVAWGIFDAIATRAGVAAGLFTNFPGFSKWIAENLGKAFSSMSTDAAIILLGIVMLVWGWFGEHIRVVAGWRPSPVDDLSSLPETVQNRFVALEFRIDEKEVRMKAVEDQLAVEHENTAANTRMLAAMAKLIKGLSDDTITISREGREFRDQITALNETVRRNEAKLARLEGLAIRAAQRDRLENLKAEFATVDA